ncbi:MAG: M24 family metallopeptidase [Candidatus Hodarchaeota archaeon]
MLAKIEKAQEFLRSHGWDSWVVLTKYNQDIHSFYLTRRLLRSLHAVIVHASGRPILLVNQSEVEQDSSLLELDPYIVLTFTNPLEFGTRLRQALDLTTKETIQEEPEHPFARLRRILDHTRVKQQNSITKNITLAANYLDIPYHSYYSSYDALYASEHLFLHQVLPSAHIVSAFELQQYMRDTKTSIEIEEHEVAAKIGTEILDDFMEHIGPNKTELELSSELVVEIEKSAEVVFLPSVAFGESTAEPYHMSSRRKAHTEEPITINIGVRVGTTCADITWTVYLGHNPPDDLLQLQQIISQTMEKVPSLIKPALRKKEFAPMYVIDDELRNNVIAYGLHENLIRHPVGHSVGLEPHDGFVIEPRSERRFEENMILSVEPGLYFAGKYGMRQGDNYVIGKWRVEKTTHAPFELLTL